MLGFVKCSASIGELPALSVHVDESGGDEEVREKAETKGKEMKLPTGFQGSERGSGLEGWGKGGAVGTEVQAAERCEGTEGVDGISGTGEVGNDGVPRGKGRSVDKAAKVGGEGGGGR